MINIDNCKSLNDIAKILFGKANYTNREKVKKYLFENGVDWKEWVESVKATKIRYCIVCGKKLENEQKKFCSHSCSASHNNKQREKKEKQCLNCGKKVENYHKNAEFCSNTCQREYEYKKYIDAWKNGKENGISGKYELSSHIRRYMLEKTNCSCEICGCNWTNPKSGKPIVEVHHKDGNAFNNKEENLQVLCPNHHAMTENYGNNNKLGRKKRLDNASLV